jgi:hypothetical protein
MFQRLFFHETCLHHSPFQFRLNSTASESAAVHLHREKRTLLYHSSTTEHSEFVPEFTATEFWNYGLSGND